LVAGEYTVTLVQSNGEGAPDQNTDVTVTVCGTELNDWSVTAPEQSEKTIFAEGYTADIMCSD
jgi:hypothetical protein